MDTNVVKKAKPHRQRAAGPKAQKKKDKIKQDENLTARQRNPKAFAVQSVNKTSKLVRRSLDIKTKKHHIPIVDRTPIEPPPIIIGIVGPTKVGKTTLLQCLVKNFTKQKLSTVEGPVTVVSGKQRRLTFIECNNDINSMIDIAKVADLILLLVDASFGFEMETFEFLNICQVHGFPRIMGVLTHLDMFKNSTKLRKTKKKLKRRFWTEIYQGAKLFYLSGLINGEYQKTEIHNLCRFISVMKFRPLQWRTTHPYILADRLEDITDLELIRQNKKCDRKVSLYGYVHGTQLKNQSEIHIPGCGDFRISNVHSLPDPCPLPNEEKKKRSLNAKERLIYAPMCGVGSVVYDKDAVYIDLGGSHSHTEKDEAAPPANEFLSTMMDIQESVDKKMASSQFTLFSGALPQTFDSGERSGLTSTEIPGIESSETDTDEDSSDNLYNKIPHKRKKRKKERHLSGSDEEENQIDNLFCDKPSQKARTSVMLAKASVENSDNDSEERDSLVYEGASSDDDGDDDLITAEGLNLSDDEDASDAENSSDDASEKDNEEEINDDPDSNSDVDNSEIDEQEEASMKWKRNMVEKAAETFMARQNERVNYRKMIYGQVDNSSSEEEEEDELGGLFKVLKKKRDAESHRTIGKQQDCSKYFTSHVVRFDIEEIREAIKDCFVTGKWEKSDDAAARLKQDDDLYGSFEDLETGEVFEGDADDSDKEDSDHPSDQDTKDDEQVEKQKKKSEMTALEKRMKRKRKLKEMFDNEYDLKDESAFYDSWKAEAELQAKLNREEFEKLPDEMRVQLEGFRPGMYVRVEIDSMPCEFITNFDAAYPVILGGIKSLEANIGCVQARIKKHRWHKRILKNRNPLIFSLGWRRFQSIPVYSIQDHNFRHRMLKYTPEHLHCHATFWGPITPQGTGLLAVESVSETTSNFHVAATGVILELDKSMQIVKKLKLTGHPFKIYRKTAFIQGMFNSSLEVAKFEGANIKTVSGIRGQIKKAVHTPDGAFRATFEDKLLLSDIVFVRTWYPIDIPKFYTPVTTLLCDKAEKTRWVGMKSTGQLRKERGITLDQNADSFYKKVERKPLRFKPLKIPRELQKDLPFKDTPKIVKEKPNPLTGMVVIREPHEAKIAKMMKMLKSVNDHKLKMRKMEMREHVTKHQKKMEIINKGKEKKSKERKKDVFARLGRIEQKKNKYK